MGGGADLFEKVCVLCFFRTGLIFLRRRHVFIRRREFLLIYFLDSGRNGIFLFDRSSFATFAMLSGSVSRSTNRS